MNNVNNVSNERVSNVRLLGPVVNKTRVPFLVSVGNRLYVHFSEVTQLDGLAAFKGMLRPVRAQLTAEIRETDNVGKIEIHGMLAWGNSLDTVSLSEFGMTRDSL